MLNNYRIYRRRQDLGTRINQLHCTEQLAVGILDTGNLQQLKETLDWFLAEINCSLHVVTQEDRIDVVAMQEAYREVTFLVFSTMTFAGERINAVANECHTNYFLIVRSDQILIRFDGNKLLSLMGKSDHPAALAAVIANGKCEVVPCVRAPFMEGKKIEPRSYFPNMEDDSTLDTLFPVMCIGFYDRALFQRMRGFDEQIHSEYWQALDWGIRCYLYGYTIQVTQALMVQFPQRDSVIEDRTEADGYLRCYTKALSVSQINGKNMARKYKGFVDKEVFREDVKKRMIWLQKTDFPTLCEKWEYPLKEKP
ncbi:hypothetical protein SpiGrapes_3188 [Sphaerochaeta pleomorpha str. Grapes]|uniref:Glycosyltransferase n=1 Tax=Sphaerochaeta pleomorpha (strain ATCC BAA-1885 / DSM 22778 / Grapes) TaxID=158190 RepID=G8QQK3_SPHPG|nr:hypothetical protein [Sphaerochaeta pleomorpha]AEV30933.1 hypothetical protein SpiGrapes_3188 [Sphaerochaeta pleomorpha str. Grapes]